MILVATNDGWRFVQIVEGTPGHVDFSPEDILKHHKANPGATLALAHTHPPHLYDLSKRDEITLKTWAWTISPFPMRMFTIAQRSKSTFRVCIYFGHLESKASWKMRNELAESKDERQYELLLEEEFEVDIDEDKIDPWMNIIIRKSYTED